MVQTGRGKSAEEKVVEPENREVTGDVVDVYSECTDDVNGVSARDQLSRTSRRGEAPVSNGGKRGQVKRKWIRRETSLSKKILEGNAED